MRQTSYLTCYEQFSFGDDYFNGDDDNDGYNDDNVSDRRLATDDTAVLYDRNSTVGSL